MNTACLLVGSNIDPLENTRKALEMLHSLVEITAISRTWEIPSIGSPGPNFINFAILTKTPLNALEIKHQVIGKIETSLHRVRSSDKNAPRTIDIDLILFNDELLEPEIWNRPYVALPVSDLLPKLKMSHDIVGLHEVAQKLMGRVNAVIRDDVTFN